MITVEQSINRLSAYGYEPDPLNLEEAITTFQGFNGLLQSGELNDDTLRMLHIARCSCPDFSQSEEAVAAWPPSMKDANGVYQVRTRHVISGLNPLAAEQEHAAWIEAISNINSVCGAQLTYQESGHAHISATVGVLDSGTLAYSFLPIGASNTSTMKQEYNRAVIWTYSLLMQVITHEVMHALGVSHGPPGSLMQPTASGNILRPQEWDIKELQKRYGTPKNKPIEPTGDGRIVMPSNNVIQISAREAGIFGMYLTSESDKVTIGAQNKITFTATKPGTYNLLLIPKVNNVQI